MLTPRAPRTRTWAIVGIIVTVAALVGATVAHIQSEPARAHEPQLLEFTSPGGTLREALTHSPRVHLNLDHIAKVSGFIGGSNLAPGQTITGATTLDTGPGLPPGPFSFSIGATVDLSTPSASRLDEALLVESMTYGGSELAPLLDANHDGKSTLRELATGVTGLTPPAPSGAGGSVFALRLLFDPATTGNGSQFAAQEARVTFSFTLIDMRVLAPPVVVVTASEQPMSGMNLNVTFEFDHEMNVASVLGALTKPADWLVETSLDNKTFWVNKTNAVAGSFIFAMGTGAQDVDSTHMASPATLTLDVLPQPTKPGSPPEVTAAQSAAGVLLSWSAVTDDGHAPITVYTIYQNGVMVGQTGALSFLAEGLSQGTSYTFQVSAWNERGEGPRSTPITLVFGSATTTADVSPGPNPAGWHNVLPLVTLAATPPTATIWFAVDGGAEQTYSGPFTMPTGIHTLSYGSRLAGTPDEAAHSRTFQVDTAAPTFSSGVASLSGTTIFLSAAATDDLSGISSIVAHVFPPFGGDTLVALPGGAGTFTAPTGGAYGTSFEAFDAAGNRVALGGPAVIVDPALFPPTTPPEEGPGEEQPVPVDPLEPAGDPTGAPGSNPTNPGRAPQLEILDPSGQPVSGTQNIDGNVTLRVDNAPNPGETYIVVISPNGTEIFVAEGSSASWDTTDVPDGTYTVETRERQSDGSSNVLASRKVVVFHARATPLEATAAVATGVAIATATSAAASSFSAASSNVVAARVFSFFDMIKNYAANFGEDRLRERTKHYGRRHLALGSLWAGAIAITVLAAFFTLADIEGWDWGAYFAHLPLIAGATIVFFSIAYGGEVLLSAHTGARADFRLLLSGGIALVISSVFLRNPFGYAGYVEKDEAGDDDRLPQRRLGGLRVFGIYGLYLAATLPFLAIGLYWPGHFDVLESGLDIAITILATSTMPLRPLPGYEIWIWRKDLAIGFTILGFVLYFAYQLAWMSPLWFQLLGVIGLAAFIAAWFLLAREADRLREMGLAVAKRDDY